MALKPSVDEWNQFLDSLLVHAVRLTVGLLQPFLLDRDQSREISDEPEKRRGAEAETLAFHFSENRLALFGGSGQLSVDAGSGIQD